MPLGTRHVFLYRIELNCWLIIIHAVHEKLPVLIGYHQPDVAGILYGFRPPDGFGRVGVINQKVGCIHRQAEVDAVLNDIAGFCCGKAKTSERL